MSCFEEGGGHWLLGSEPEAWCKLEAATRVTGWLARSRVRWAESSDQSAPPSPIAGKQCNQPRYFAWFRPAQTRFEKSK